MTGYSPRTSSRRLLIGGVVAVLAVVALAVVAGVWLLRGRADATRSITERSATLAIDRFVAAWNERDDDDLAARACAGTRNLVLVSAEENRDVVGALHRVGPAPVSTGSGRTVAVARVVGRAKADGSDHPTTVTAAGRGTRWCVSSMGGVFRTQR